MSTKSRIKISQAFNKVSCVELKLQIETVNDLLSCYKRRESPYSGVFETHPLCFITEVWSDNGFSDCLSCLWEMIEGEQCDEFSKRLFDIPRYYISGTKKWRKVIVPMLKRWEKILKIEKKRLSKDKNWGC